MSILDPTALPDSQADLSIYEFYLDGRNQLTSAEVFRLNLPVGAQVIGFGLEMAKPRTAGTLQMQLLRNGMSVNGGTLTINAVSTQSVRATNLNLQSEADDILTLEVTTAVFAPLDNVGRFNLLIK